MSKIIETVQSLTFRKWLYGVSLAVLVFLGGEGIISATQQDNLGAIAAAVLQTAPAAALGLAYRKVTPAVNDDTHAITEDEVAEVPLAATFDLSNSDSTSTFVFDAVTDGVEPTADVTRAKHADI